MPDLLTIREASKSLRKSPRWLRAWLKDHPADDDGTAFYLQVGRDKLFSERDIARIEAKIRELELTKPTRSVRTSGQIYFIEIEGFIKIGWAIDARARIKWMQVGSPFTIKIIGVSLGTQLDERALHKRFAEHRHRGEWFKSTPQLRREIKALSNYPLTKAVRQ